MTTLGEVLRRTIGVGKPPEWHTLSHSFDGVVLDDNSLIIAREMLGGEATNEEVENLAAYVVSNGSTNRIFSDLNVNPYDPDNINGEP